MGNLNKWVKIAVIKEEDGYVAFPIGLKGIVVGDGDTFEEALSSVRGAIKFHLETFGEEVLKDLYEAKDIYIGDTEVSI